jgi:hypothetical protein
MSVVLSEKKLHKIARIDQVVNDYFQQHPAMKEVAAKELMPNFIAQGVFFKDQKRGAAIRDLLRRLNSDGKLHLLRYCKVVRKEVNKNWYFVRP